MTRWPDQRFSHAPNDNLTVRKQVDVTTPFNTTQRLPLTWRKHYFAASLERPYGSLRLRHFHRPDDVSASNAFAAQVSLVALLMNRV